MVWSTNRILLLLQLLVLFNVSVKLGNVTTNVRKLVPIQPQHTSVLFFFTNVYVRNQVRSIMQKPG